MADDIPFAFDADFYRENNADLTWMTADEAAAHFREHGMAEGRQGSPWGRRLPFVDRLGKLGSVLEIGPFCNPVMHGPHIRYLDMLDADQLRARATELGLDPAGCPEHIHHVGGIETVDAMFDGVISCHSVEHQPDLIHHFEGVARILRPGGGRYHLIIPDKRYCFDHFIAESTVADVVQAHEERRTRHTLKSVIEHWTLVTHNDAVAHWRGEHGARIVEHPRRLRDAIGVYRGTEDYIDVHAWYFTPTSFWDVTSTLHAAGLSPLRPVEIHATGHNTPEFFAVLERD